MWELAALRAAEKANGNRGSIASVRPRELSPSGAESNNRGFDYLKSFATLFRKRVGFVLGLDSSLNFDGFLSDDGSNTIVINAESLAG